jgi:pimeloyl-ACP methyl ester carboxylesterase
MDTEVVSPSRPARRGGVIALHCSGAGPSQWRPLAEALGGGFALAAPEHYGNEGTGPWTGEHAFTLADEASRTIGLVDGSEGKVHLVGHSYGGGVALKAALARPDRIASLALYEPSAFHLLRDMGPEGAEALAEIMGVARRVGEGVIAGEYCRAVAGFVDYWNGPGAWQALRPAVQAALTRWVPKAPLDFRALIEEPTGTRACLALRMPVLILRGERAPPPTRVIAERLSRLLADGRLQVVRGAGHMGPLTHAADVAARMAEHICMAETAGQRRWQPGGIADAAIAAA